LLNAGVGVSYRQDVSGHQAALGRLEKALTIQVRLERQNDGAGSSDRDPPPCATQGDAAARSTTGRINWPAPDKVVRPLIWRRDVRAP